ncbi:hypothetical protein BTVI_141988 [Pitangus sulphuratus]|nr:hypothetical protein BTVI_141988 [Pitangus sulphuratus]
MNSIFLGSDDPASPNPVVSAGVQPWKWKMCSQLSVVYPWNRHDLHEAIEDVDEHKPKCVSSPDVLDIRFERTTETGSMTKNMWIKTLQEDKLLHIKGILISTRLILQLLILSSYDFLCFHSLEPKSPGKELRLRIIKIGKDLKDQVQSLMDL